MKLFLIGYWIMGKVHLIQQNNKHMPAFDSNVLSEREIEIIKLASEGFTSREIADELELSIDTIETHRKNIIHKTNQKNFIAVVSYAFRTKLLVA
jgi:DNA-binding NarL/FixJ family response regulator